MERDAKIRATLFVVALLLTLSVYAAPQISSISTTSGAEFLTVSWSTNETASSNVSYAVNTSAAYDIAFSGTLSNYSAGPTVSHSILVGPLHNATFYYFALQSCNANGHCGNSSLRNFTTSDVDKPTVTIQSPIAKNYTTATVSLNFTLADNVAINTAGCTVNKNDASSSISGCLNTTVTLSEGENNITVIAQDTSSNTGNATVTTWLDTTAPGAPLLESLPDTTSRMSQNVSGFANESNVTIYLRLLNESTGIYYQTQGFSQIKSNLTGVGTVATTQSAGQTSVQVSGSASAFATGRYVQFSHVPAQYRYYSVTASTDLGGGQVQLAISPALSATVTSGENVAAYDGALPTGWFQFNITLAADTTTLRVFAEDHLGNQGPVSTQTITLTTNITAANFDNALSTNLSNVDISAIHNLSLANPAIGQVNFTGVVDLVGANLDNNIIFGPHSLFVNSSALPQLNRNATIALFSQSFEYVPHILRDSASCTNCANISYSSGTFIFNVSGFSNYTLTPNSRLNAFSQGTQLNHPLRVLANYTATNSSQGAIWNATCQVSFSDLAGNMSFNATSAYYEFNRSFATSGAKTYLVWCNATGHENASTSSTLQVDNNSMPNMVSVAITSTSTSGTPGTDTNLNCMHLPANDSDELRIDLVIDADGNATPYADITNNYNITNGQALTNFSESQNLTFYDQDNDGIYQYNGTKTESIVWDRDGSGTYTAGDYVILQANGLLSANAPLKNITNATNLSYYDLNANSQYDNGELIVLEPQKDNRFDGGITYQYEWFVRSNTSSSFRSCSDFSWCDNDNVEVLAHGNTAVGDQWICEVTPSDSFGAGTAMNSSTTTIGATIDGVTPTLSPIIINVSDNTNFTSPLTVDGTVQWTVNWTDADSRQVRIYICNSTAIIKNSGCFDFEFARTLSEGPGLATLEFNASAARVSHFTDDMANETYYVMACDDSYNCSSIVQGDLVYNRAPAITGIQIAGSPFTDTTNLYCNVSTNDTDAQTVIVSYTWYVNRTGAFSLYDIPSNRNLTNGNTVAGDQWLCQARPYDGYAYGSAMNSSKVTIAASANAGNMPNITAVWDDSSPTQQTAAGNDITFYINWTDPDSSQVRLYICNSTLIEDNGCAETTYNRTDLTSQNPIFAKYTTPITATGTYAYYARICDAGYNCSNNYPIAGATLTTNFTVNSRPSANVTISPTTLTPTDTLSCVVSYGDAESHSENTSVRQYHWYVNIGSGFTLDGVGSTHGPLAAGYQAYCSVLVTDSFGANDSQWRSSPTVTVATPPSLPTVWPLPPFVATPNVSVVGYLNESGTAFAFARQGVQTPINRSAVSTGSQTLNASGITTAQSSQSANYLVISQENATLFTPGLWIEIVNYPLSWYLRYNITENVNLLDGTYRINVSPVLEQAIPAGAVLRAFNQSTATGWFNITLPLFANNNTVGIRGESTSGSGATRNLTTFYDAQAPSIVLSAIPNATASNTSSFTISIIDNYGINASTFNMTLSSISLRFNLSGSCTGSPNATCVVAYSDLPDGAYNITTNITDYAGHSNGTFRNNLSIDTQYPLISYVNDSGSVTGNKSLTFAWPASSSLSGISAYEIALGTAVYPDAGYASIQTFSRINTTSAMINASLQANTVYYAQVRAISGANRTGAVTTSNGILFMDTTVPDCTLDARSGNICARFPSTYTNNNGTLQVYWNFTDAESGIADYEYAIGTATYPNTGFDILVPRTSTSSNDFTISGLSLAHGQSYFINVKSRNTFGLWSDWFTSANTTIDLVPPYNGSISYPNGFIAAATTFVSVKEGIDNLSGIASVQMDIGKTAMSQQGTCPGTYLYELFNVSGFPRGDVQVNASLQDGYCYKFRYTVTDRAGNSKVYPLSNETMVTRVDSTPPSPVTVYDNGFYTYLGTELNASWSNSVDAESGIALYRYAISDPSGIIFGWQNTTQTSVRVTGLNLSHQQTYYVNVTAVSNANLSSNISSSDGIMYLDVTPPSPVVVVSVDNDTNSSDGWIDLQDNGNTTISAWGEPGIQCVYNATDIDYSTAYGTVCNATTIDTQTQVNCTINNLAQETYTYHIACMDANGNKQDYTQNTDVSFSVDWPDTPVAQNLTITALSQTGIFISNSTAYTDSILNCSATFTDADGNMTREASQIRWYNSTNLSAAYLVAENSTLNLSQPGFDRDMNISCLYRVYDTSGLVSDWINTSSTINNSPPLRSQLRSPSTFGLLNRLALFNWSNSSDADSDTLWYQLDIANDTTFGVLNTTLNGTGTTAYLNTTNLTDGVWYWRVRACDNTSYANTCAASDNQSFRVDNTAPNVTILAPTNTQVVGGSILLQAEIFDLIAGISSVTYNVSNGTGTWAYGNLSSSGSNIWQVTWHTNESVPNGTYSLQIISTDLANNSNTSVRNFTVDNSVPLITIWTPNYNERYVNTNITLNVSIRDFTDANITVINWTGALLINQTNTSVVVRDLNWTHFLNVENLSNGNYTLIIDVVDNVSNFNHDNFTFFVDRLPPAWSGQAINQDVVYNDVNPTISATWPNSWNQVANRYDLSVVYLFYNISLGSYNHIFNSTFYPNNPPTGEETFSALINASVLNNTARVEWWSTAIDFAGNSNSTPLRNFTVRNRAPLLNQSLTPTLAEDQNTTINLSGYYIDPDNNAVHAASDTLTYSVTVFPQHTLFYQDFENATSLAVFGNATQVSFVPGEVGNAATIQTGTTNLLLNPGFEILGNSPANWTATGAPEHNTSGLYNASGDAGVRVNVNSYWYQDVPVTASQTYTLSAKLRNSSGTSARLHIEWLSGALVSLGNNLDCSNCSSNPYVNDSFARYSTTAQAPASAAYARVMADSAAVGYVLIDEMQFEEHSVATSYTNASRANSHVTFATSGRINAQQGTIAFWMIPYWNATDTTPRTLIDADDFTGLGLTLTRNINQSLQMTLGSASISAPMSPIVHGVPLHIALAWNETSMRLFINGTVIARYQAALSQPVLPADFSIGSTLSPFLYQADASFDEFIIFNASLSDARVRQIVDDGTTSSVNVTAAIQSTTQLFLQAGANYHGTNVLRIFANDNHGLFTYTDMLPVTVTSVNDLPAFSAFPTVQMTEDIAQAFAINLNDYVTDADNEPVSFTFSTLSAAAVSITPVRNILQNPYFANNTGTTAVNWTITGTNGYNLSDGVFASIQAINLSFLPNTTTATLYQRAISYYKANSTVAIAFWHRTNDTRLNRSIVVQQIGEDGSILNTTTKSFSGTAAWQRITTTVQTLTISNATLNISVRISPSADDIDAWDYLARAEANISGNYTSIMPAADQSGLYNVTVFASDASATANTTLIINITAVNDAPTFTGTIPNTLFPEDSVLTNWTNLEEYFLDIDSDLTYTFFFTNTSVNASVKTSRDLLDNGNFSLDANSDNLSDAWTMTGLANISRSVWNTSYSQALITTPGAGEIAFHQDTSEYLRNATNLTWQFWYVINDTNMTGTSISASLQQRDSSGNVLSQQRINLSNTTSWSMARVNMTINSSPANLRVQILVNATADGKDSNLSLANMTLDALGAWADIYATTNFSSNSTLVINATDGEYTVSSNAIRVNVTNINDPPQVSSSLSVINVTKNTQATQLNLSAYVTDPDHDAITYTLVSVNTSNVSASISGENISLLAQHNWYGLANATFQATDGQNTTTASFLLNVTTLCPQPLDGSDWQVSNATCMDESLTLGIINVTGAFTLQNTSLTFTTLNGYGRLTAMASALSGTLRAAQGASATFTNTTISTLIASGNASVSITAGSISNLSATQENISATNLTGENRTGSLLGARLNLTFTDTAISWLGVAGNNSVTVQDTTADEVILTDATALLNASTISNLRIANSTATINATITTLRASANATIQADHAVFGTLGSLEGLGIITFNGSLATGAATTIIDNTTVLRYYEANVTNAVGIGYRNATLQARSGSVVLYNGTTRNGSLTINLTFNTTTVTTAFDLYVEDLKLSTIALHTSSPIALSNGSLDEDNDGIPDRLDDDNDNDGISNSADSVWGNLSDVTTNVTSLNMTINASSDLSGNYSGELQINVTADNNIRINYTHNFSTPGSMPLSLYNITITYQNNSNRSSLQLLGFTPLGTKDVQLPRAFNLSNAICIKDDANAGTTLSSACTSAGETLVACPGTSGNYNCSATNTTFSIRGLGNSTMQEYYSLCGDGVCDGLESSSTCSADCGSGGGGGTGGGGGSSGGGGSGGYFLPATKATCSDNKQNGNETGIDCGGDVCGACLSGQNCSVNSDCLSGYCGPAPSGSASATAGVCAAPTCSDHVRNQGETGIDCGGPCNSCAQVASCYDRIRNQGETGIDCGGPCTACAPSITGAAVTATCSDGIQNQAETGLDCGGPCAPCTTPRNESGLPTTEPKTWIVWILLPLILLLLIGIVWMLVANRREHALEDELRRQHMESLRQAPLQSTNYPTSSSDHSSAGQGALRSAALYTSAMHTTAEVAPDVPPELANYVKSLSLAGTGKRELLQKLTDAGWPPATAADAIDNHYVDSHAVGIQRLADYIASQMAAGRDVSEVRQFLVISGWDDELIDEALRRARQ